MLKKSALQDDGDYINMDKNLIKPNSRRIDIVSKEDFKKALWDIYVNSEHYDEDIDYDNFPMPSIKRFTPHKDRFLLDGELLRENAQIEKDLDEIYRCYDNFNATPETNEDVGYVGYLHLKNGAPFIGIIDYGDEEQPSYYILYMSNGIVRAYTPKYGNVLNLDFKSGIGIEHYDSDVYDRVVIEKGYRDDFEDDETVGWQYSIRQGLDIEHEGELDLNYEAMMEDINLTFGIE